MATPKEILDQTIGFFKGLSLVQKVVFGTVIVGAIVALVALSLRNPQAGYKVLYSGLTQEDAAQVVSRLKEQRIPYTLEKDESVIKVPPDQVHETRLTLAGEGLPRGGGVGFEIFDKTSLGTTDFVQRLNYQRALQGELARTIMQIQQLSYARVHLAIPKESVFVEDEKQPSASVIVKLRGREKLSSMQIRAVVNLVASAVPGLTPSHITVADTEGRLLFREEGDQETLLSATQLEYQFKLEEGYRKKVESLLEEVVGVGKAQVRVTADIDFDRVNMTQENFDPEGQVVRSEQLSNEEDTSGGTPETGIPGVKGNLATYAEPGDKTTVTGEKRTRSNVTRNYEITKVTKQVQAATGAIKRLSVAVMVDGTYTRKEGEASGPLQYQPRSKEEIDNFSRIVKNAIGYNEDRGDQVEVVGVPFALSKIGEPVQTAMDKWGTLIDKLVIPLVSLLIVIAIILFVVRPFLKMLAEKQRQAEELLVKIGKEGEVVFSEEEEELGLAPKKMSDKERIYKLAQSDPDRAADLVRRWLREER